MIFGSTDLYTNLDFTGFQILETPALRLACQGRACAMFENPERHLVFAAQGRIDNPQDLQPFTGVCSGGPEYMWRAYLAWGKKCASRLLGDWLFFACNTLTGEVFLARDQNGSGEVFYRQTPHGLVFGSSVSLLTATGKELNLPFALSRLSRWNYEGSETQTLFRGIEKILPGHSLTWFGGRLTFYRYWQPEQIPLKCYKQTQDYADELLEITKEAVRCRIPGNAKVAAMLSGGLDSGTVAYLAAECLGNAPLVTFSHVPLYPHRNPAAIPRCIADESPYIKATAATRTNIKPFLLQSATVSPIQSIRKLVAIHNSFAFNGSSANWVLDIYEHTAAQGVEVLLSGQFGNVALSYTGSRVQLPMPPGLKALKQKVVRPLLKNLLEYRAFEAYFSSSFLNKSLLGEYGIRKDVLLNRSCSKTFFFTKQEEMMYLTQRGNRNRLASTDSEFPFEILDPTADSRILEYCMAIPNQFFFNEKSESKQVLKRMMAGRLPDMVLNEKGRGLQGSDIDQRLITEADILIDYCRHFEKNAVFSHFADTSAMIRSLQQLKTDTPPGLGQLNCLLKLVAFGFFLEQNGF